MRRKFQRWWAGAVVIGLCSLAAACGSSSGAPSGWQTVTVRGVDISVPASWKVVKEPMCMPANPPGVLVYGDGTWHFAACPQRPNVPIHNFVAVMGTKTGIVEGATGSTVQDGVLIQSVYGAPAGSKFVQLPDQGVSIAARGPMRNQVIATVKKAQ